jgi:23S rRNA (uridine2552-2'-O)-methyltransferase
MGSAGTLRDRRGRHDVFYQRAKRENFAARSVYKLQEMDERLGIFRPGQRVLDLGCRPGSWLQYASQKVGPKGALVGIDRQPLDASVVERLGPGARILVGDVFTVTADELRGELAAFDVVLSDMAPDTSGVRHLDQARSEGLFERALDLAELLLAPGGHFVGKLFQGPEWNALLARLRKGFAEARPIKPEGSRKDSIEQYLVGLRKKPAPSPAS